ncbi:hypothetical protein GCM10011344_08490 [Dokdonia pacifica]|uniref:HYR domain-containing protein n=1 Tax=Dokdonia pacifica TaxID=1627892 RepID=A0A238YTC1_9FLAO|nr:LamG domain-containing protein [Dokdonia pacifica]GGG10121.1 hypothetical protein GCM10011344_08490 [Dokdonia pacifica]SNR74377.1 HYR domain-containing protein [Dokdonia pacifica]
MLKKSNILLAKILTLISVSITSFSFGQKDLLLHFTFNHDVENKSSYNLTVEKFGNTSFTEGRNGLACNALEFNGSNYLSVLHDDAFNQIKNEFTVTSWLKVSKTTNDDHWITLICKGDDLNETTSNPHFRAQAFQNNYQSTVSVNTEFTEYDFDFAKHKIETDKWFHFSLVCSQNIVSVYFNGNKVWSFQYYNNFNSNFSPLYIGRDIPGADEFFVGAIDDLKLFNRSLSETEIINEMYTINDVDFSNEITCSNNIKVYCSKNSCDAEVDYLTTSNSPCVNSKSSVVKGLPSGSLFPVGINKVVLKKTNNNRTKFCQFTIEVIDTISPIINCPKDTVIIAKSLPVKVFTKQPLVYDNCSAINLKKLDTLFTDYGKHHKFYYATDDSGNTSMCEQIIEIKKETAELPPISKPKPTKPIIKDSIITKDSFELTKKIHTVFLYDHKYEDGDIISLFFNSEEIIHKKKIYNKDNKKKDVITAKIELKTGSNFLTIKAWNTGTKGLNTVSIEIYEGEATRKDFLSKRKSPVYNNTIDSEIGIASAINLILK